MIKYFFFFILGVISLFLLIIANDYRHVPERGDKMEFISNDKECLKIYNFYKSCDMTYITEQALEEDNVTVVLLKNCFYQKTLHLDIFSSSCLKRK